MAGRGRGRGRGKEINPVRPGDTSNSLTTAKQEHAIASSKTDEFDDLKKSITALNTSSQDRLDEFAKKAQCFATSDEKYIQLIDYLYEKAFEDSDFAQKAAVIMTRLTFLEEGGSTFRSNLLKRAQEHYKNRESMRAQSLSNWTGLVHLMCEIFKVLRIGGSPLKPLASSVYQMLTELLRGCHDATDSEGVQLDCFYTQFRNVGQILESIDQHKMDTLMCSIRDTILCSSSTQQTRGLLTQALELKASKWHLQQEVECFYADALADILASQG